MANGSDNSFTVAGPRISRLTTDRRVGSERAWNALSRDAVLFAMWRTIKQ